MKPNHIFQHCGKPFWATVKSLSEEIGYSKKGQIIVPNLHDVVTAFERLNLHSGTIISPLNQNPTDFFLLLQKYFHYRAHVLTEYVQPKLMNLEQARIVFDGLKRSLDPKCPLPMNKQKGEKRVEAFLTCIVNMTIESHIQGRPCDYDPRRLTSFTRKQLPLRTLSRRIDGAFPSIVNPIAIWEIKEYYHTTTFGSRIADGVYETLLDGMELEELRIHEGVHVKHYLMVDSRQTWWDLGKSYLCRMIDILHMGYVDEILFGYEVVEQLPRIVSEWIESYELRNRSVSPF